MIQLSNIVQLGGVLRDIPIFGNNFLRAAKGTVLARNLGKKNLYQEIGRFNKEHITGSGITLTNNKKNILSK